MTTSQEKSCHTCSCAHGHAAHGGPKHAWKKLAASAFFFALALLLPAGLEIKLLLYIASYLLSGGTVLIQSARNLKAGKIFDENFLMTLATFGGFAIGEYPEAAAVMLFYQTGELLQEAAAGKSRRNIVKLMDLRPDFARVVRNGKAEKVNPKQVRVGEITRVLPGERIPLDGILTAGEGQLDTSALTGESRPRRAQAGQQILAGCISMDGTLEIRTQKTYENSTVAKILELAENAANKKSTAEKFITRFARVYTPAVIALAAAVALVPPLLWTDASFKTWFYRALVFMVISCPCALVLSVPLGFFGGIGGAAKNGILVKASSCLERLANIYILALDKTGTLTQGVFKITAVCPAPGAAPQELLALAARAEAGSNHPVAKAIVQSVPLPSGPEKPQSALTEYSGEGIVYTEPETVILAGNLRLLERFQVIGAEPGTGTCVYLAQNGLYKGRIELGDQPKPGAKESLAQLQKLGCRLVMLSGDTPAAAEKTARELGIMRVYAGLLPGDKVARLEELMDEAPRGAAVAFAGDGMNDAPVLARADLSIAMGGLGSDAAIEAADVVLMTDDLSKIPAAIRLSRRTLRVIKQNIIFALAVKAAVLALGVCGLANMWAAVFADVGVSLLAVANSLRPLYFKE